MAQFDNLPTREIQPPKASTYNGVESKKSDNVLKAGGDLIWQDDFSSVSNWTIATSGQGTFVLGDNTHAEMVSNVSYLGNMSSTTASNGFAFFNGTQYLIPEIVDPQNTSVTSQPIDLTGYGLIILTFEQRYRPFTFDQTFVEASYDGGVTWVYSEEVNAWETANSNPIQNTVTLHIPTPGSAATLIRFRWFNPSDDNIYGGGYGWCIDDVEIREGYGNDIALHRIFATVGGIKIPVTKIPLSQVAGGAEKIQFKSLFKNNGYNSLPVSMNVTGSGYNFETASVTVNSLNRDSLQINDADGMTIPAVIGSAGIMTSLVSSASMNNTSDDSAPVLFDVTENIYAVDAYDGTVGSYNGYFTSWSGSNGDVSIGNQFEIYAEIEGGSIGIGIADIPVAEQSTYMGREFFGLIYVFNAATGDFEYFNETNVKALEASDFGSVVYLNMNGFTLPAGRYLIMAASYALNYVPFAFSGSVPNQSVYGMDMGSLVSLGGATYPNTIKAPVVRINTEPCSVQETLTINTCASYTSPSGNYTWTTSGTYADTVTFNGTCDTIFTINLTIGSQQAPVVTTYVQPSGANDCVGTVAINILGTPNFTCEIDGAAPFTNSGYGLADMLCGGVHVLDVTDACGTSVTHTFIVPVDSNYVFNNPFIDSIAVDSLGNTIEDCDIYYNGIDTAFIDSIFANGNSVTVIWNIVDSNGSNLDTSNYILNNGNGVYYLQLSVFCPNRAVGEYFVVGEAIYFEDGSISTAGLNDTEQSSWVEIFPNPTSGLVTINTGSNSTRLDVVDAQGRIVLTEVDFQQKTISLEPFRSGIYFFHLSSDKGTVVARVMKR
jgi:hypothetical protein